MCFLKLPSLKQQEIHKRIGLKFKDVIIMICDSQWSKNMIVGFKTLFGDSKFSTSTSCSNFELFLLLYDELIRIGPSPKEVLNCNGEGPSWLGSI